MSVDTSIGYVTKPKRIVGYKIEKYYCECGCKSGYWHYRKIHMIHTTEKTEKVKYALVKDDVSITTCNHEDLKEDWQWVGKKDALITFFIVGNQDKAHVVISKIHDGYFKAKNKSAYIKSINGKTFTDTGVKKK